MEKSLLFTTLLYCNFLFGSTFTVTNSSDSGPGSFRQALIDLNNSSPIESDTIEFGPLVILPIILSSELPIINRRVIIYGNNAIIDGNGRYRFTTIFEKSEIHDLNFQNGNASGHLLAIGTNSTCIMVNCSFINNISMSAILSNALGELTLDNCEFVNNSVSGSFTNGVLDISANSLLTQLIDCNFNGNSAHQNVSILNGGSRLILTGANTFGQDELIRLNQSNAEVEIIDGEVISGMELIIVL